MPPIDELAEEVERLRSWCLDQGHRVSPDGRIKPAPAATILGLAVGTLRNLRYQGAGPEFHRHGGRGQITYALENLAAYIQEQKKNPADL